MKKNSITLLRISGALISYRNKRKKIDIRNLLIVLYLFIQESILRRFKSKI
jgi:hypothetical protein